MTETLLPLGSADLHPVEAAIVRLALRQAPLPDDHRLDLWNLRRQLPEAVVHLRPAGHSALWHSMADAAGNALARLVEEGRQPRWPAAPSGPGLGAAGARRHRPRLRHPVVRILACQLLAVRWTGADALRNGTAVYWLAWIASADCWVVTASAATCADQACHYTLLGAFAHQPDVFGTACLQVRAHWQRLRDQRHAPRWTLALDGGRVDRAQVQALGDGVWTTGEPLISHAGARMDRQEPALC